MPRYYFHLIDGGALADEEGIELPDLDAARGMAAEFLGAALRDAGKALFQHRDWRLEVTDAVGLILFTILLAAYDSAAIAGASRS